MPRPATLPILDWKAVFESGLDYQAWLAAAESAEQHDKMEAQRQALTLDAPVAGFLAALPRPVHVVAIAEDWCGDVVRHAPVLQRMAEAGPNLKVHYVSREQHPDLFARFLTNGGEAIPKFIFLSDRFVECGNWGPCPSAAGSSSPGGRPAAMWPRHGKRSRPATSRTPPAGRWSPSCSASWISPRARSPRQNLPSSGT